jgi:malate synthase
MKTLLLAVDAEDKVKCYQNWLGLMKGDLTANVEKNGKKFVRKLNPDREYTSRHGKKLRFMEGRYYLIETWVI